MTPASGKVSSVVVLDQVSSEMRDRGAGATFVRDIRVVRRADSSGQDAIFFVLVLSDPPEGQQSWPVDDLRSLRRLVGEIIESLETEIDLPWFVVFEPEHQDLDDDDPQLGFAVDA
jgi:hypothetical protein